MKRKLLLLLIALSFSGLGWGQTQIHLVDFESTGQTGYTTSIAEFTDNSGDYFTSSSNGTMSVTLSNIQGSNFFGAQDTDGDGGPDYPNLYVNNIDISGYTSLELRVYLAEDDDGSNQDWDSDTYLHISCQIDGGSSQNLLWVEAKGETNTEPAIDADFNGTGDTGSEITSTFVQYTASITGTGSDLDITFAFGMLDAGDEDIAIDHIEIYGTNSGGGTPTITLSPTILTDFTYVQGSGPSAEQTFTVSGSNLTNNISMAASTNYEISKTSGSGYATPLTFEHASGTVASTTVYVRLKAGLSAANYNGETINATSTGATAKTVTCSGTVTAPPDPEPTNHVSGFSATAAGATQINLSWGDNDGAQAADGFLILGKTGAGTYLSVADGTDPADDSDWSDNNFNVKVAHGTQSYQVTGLTAETQYDFEIYPYTNSGSDIDFKTDGTVPEQSATTDEAPSIVAPTAGVVFISEVSDASGTNNEYIEFYNNSNSIIDLSSSKLIMQNDGTVWNISGLSGDTEIPANGFFVISRGATKSAFEIEWGALPANCNYNEGTGGMYFGTSTSRRWVLKDGGTSGNDDGILIDDTESAVAGSGNRTYQYPTDTWTTEGYSENSNPGVLGSDEDPAAYLWDGGASTSNWNDANNWNPNQVPGQGTNVTIDGSKTSIQITATETATCNNLTVDGSLTIKSDATGTGSLKIGGTYSGSGTFTTERYIEGYTSATNGWHLLSSPTDNFTVASSDLEPSIVADQEDDLYYWDESQSDAGMWMNYKAQSFNLVSGKGYLAAYYNSEPKSFVGAPFNQDKTFSNLSYVNPSPTYNNTWHLLGNPYTCALIWNNTNGWDLNNIGGVAKVMNAANGSYIDVNAGGAIPAMQGFFVEVVNVTNSITIPLEAREHNAQDWYKTTSDQIVLVAYDTENNLSQQSVIRTNSLAMEQYDYRYDSRFLGFYAPQFYSKKDNQILSTNTLREITSDLSIPFGFVKNESTNFSIELLETMTDVDVYLTDLKLNIDTKLNIGSAYTFSSEEGDNPDRFLLHFGVVGIEDNTSNLSQINAYAYQNQLYVQSNLNEAQVSLFDIQGHQMLSREIVGAGSSRIPLDLPTGIYIVRLQSNNQVKNVKVFIN